MVQHHDSVPSLNCTAISIDSPHIRKDGANYLNLLLKDVGVQDMIQYRNWRVFLGGFCSLSLNLTLKVILCPFSAGHFSRALTSRGNLHLFCYSFF